MKPHKHAELIKAWADGAVIQSFNTFEMQWKDVVNNQPQWHPFTEYRVKPEPKPDKKLYYLVDDYKIIGSSSQYTHNLILTLDGETGKLKSAEVL